MAVPVLRFEVVDGERTALTLVGKVEYSEALGITTSSGERHVGWVVMTPDSSPPLPPMIPPPPWQVRCCACQVQNAGLRNCRLCKHWTCPNFGLDDKYPMGTCHKYVVGEMGIVFNSDTKPRDYQESWTPVKTAPGLVSVRMTIEDNATQQEMCRQPHTVWAASGLPIFEFDPMLHTIGRLWIIEIPERSASKCLTRFQTSEWEYQEPTKRPKTATQPASLDGSWLFKPVSAAQDDPKMQELLKPKETAHTLEEERATSSTKETPPGGEQVNPDVAEIDAASSSEKEQWRGTLPQWAPTEEDTSRYKQRRAGFSSWREEEALLECREEEALLQSMLMKLFYASVVG